MSRPGWIISALLSSLLALHAAAQESQARLTPSALEQTLFSRAPYAFVSAEFMTLSEVEAALPLLSARGVGVALAWSSTEVENPAYYDLVRRAARVGVEVRPWLLLPVELGYWPNSTNARQFDAAARRLLTRWREEGLTPTTFIVDMEMPISRVQRYGELLASLDLNATVAFLRAGINREQYAEATRVYRAFVDWAHVRGFRVELSTISQVLDDYGDFDDGLRQAFNIPVAGIDWDTYSIQAYRTLNQFVIGSIAGPTTSYYVYDYAQRTRAIFGRKGAVVLGLVDAGEVTPNAPLYESGRQLEQDLEAARAAGISRENIGVYNLRGILRRTPTDQWFPRIGLLSIPPFPDLATSLTRSSSALVDAYL
jgi:hypothetical protein